MAEEIDFENGRNSNFEGLVTLTLTFDPAIWHIVLQQSSTSTYIPTFIQIEETFCGRTVVRTDVRTGGRTFFPSILLGRLSEVDLIMHSIMCSDSAVARLQCSKQAYRELPRHLYGVLIVLFGRRCTQPPVSRQYI